MLTLCVLLWAAPGAEEALIGYEDRVLPYLADHGAKLLQRARRRSDGGPYEVQFIEFPSAEALDSYMSDPRRTSLISERDTAIARTEIIEVELIHSD